MPPPSTTVVSTAGPSILATATPLPKNAWYWPCRSSGASPKPISKQPAASHSSAITCKTAATSRNAHHDGLSANTAQAANMISPARRTAAAASCTPLTRRATRTWQSSTPPVLISSSTETTQVGASVRAAIHSGTTTLSSGM
ncbi:hypothetical protein GCM10027203_76410 [Nonomuraea fastidiosa]